MAKTSVSVLLTQTVLFCSALTNAVSYLEERASKDASGFTGLAHDDYLLPYSASFNGTLSYITSSTRQPPCGGTFKLNNYAFIIGPQDTRTIKDQSYTRSKWDSNPFWWRLQEPTPKETSDATITLQSSAGGNNTNVSPPSPGGYVYWPFTLTAAGDGVDFFSAHDDKFFIDQDYINKISTGPKSNSCTDVIKFGIGVTKGNWTMTAHVSPSKITFKTSPSDMVLSTGVRYSESWEFEGTWDSSTAKVVINGDKVILEGTNSRLARDIGSKTSASIRVSTGSGIMTFLGIIWWVFFIFM
ncbi:hypothetical protein EJ08DRAFT_646393 [Tothia fuscella]|uniref:Uncharacterized protein n=1 Tax=Tothia fuscella TaxID=1048955 RepID=A0A9P4NZX6_9PEZI|nr:hypothetical protein EJ08DRAFT_646393 [Tothia fuscella]